MLTRFHLLLFTLGVVMPAVAGATTLTGLHIRRKGHETVLVARLHGPVSFHDFALGNPLRAVLDLHHARSGISGVPHGRGPVKDVRMGHHRNGTLRLVLDLAAGAHLVGASRHGSMVHMTLTGRPARRPARRVNPHSGPIVVALDPGHGGKDPGTHGPHQLDEKTVTLAIARQVDRKLAATPHIKPVMTRDRDTYVSLPKRVAIAQAHHADLFISMHENAFDDQRSVKGGTCYILSRHGASSAEARQVAHLENHADPVVDGVTFSTRDKTVNSILTQMLQTESIGAADDLARDIIHQLGQFEPLYKRQPPRANFAVLRDPMIPSVLCETAFLSNPTQARELHSAHFRDQIADAIYHGILHYIRHSPRIHYQHSGSTLYSVKHGDSLWSIAHAHGMPVHRLMAINDLHQASIQPGEHLLVSPASGG